MREEKKRRMKRPGDFERAAAPRQSVWLRRNDGARTSPESKRRGRYYLFVRSLSRGTHTIRWTASGCTSGGSRTSRTISRSAAAGNIELGQSRKDLRCWDSHVRVENWRKEEPVNRNKPAYLQEGK